AGFNDGGTPPIYWYLIHDGRLPGCVYGIGLHSKTKTVVGYFARNGFSPSAPPRDEWFRVNSQLQSVTTAHPNTSEAAYNMSEPVFLLADGKLWRIDVARRQLKAVVDCPAAYALGRSWQIPDKSQLADEAATAPDEIDSSGRPKLPENADRIAVRQPDGVIIYDRRTGKQESFPLPHTAETYGISTWLLPDGNLVVLRFADYEKKLPSELMWLDPAGQLVKQQTVRLAEYESNVLPIPEV